MSRSRLQVVANAVAQGILKLWRSLARRDALDAIASDLDHIASVQDGFLAGRILLMFALTLIAVVIIARSRAAGAGVKIRGKIPQSLESIRQGIMHGGTEGQIQRAGSGGIAHVVKFAIVELRRVPTADLAAIAGRIGQSSALFADLGRNAIARKAERWRIGVVI